MAVSMVDRSSRLAFKWMFIRLALMAAIWTIPWIINRAPVEQVMAKLSLGFLFGSMIATAAAIFRREQPAATNWNAWDEALVFGMGCLLVRTIRIFTS
jgi:hypothetical protein